ncbi:MAG: hypothetical protein NVS4B5_20770 [Vulcanimicrobiaceae bacterium]
MFRGWIDARPSLPARISFTVVAIVAAYTQYYLVAFVVAGLASIVIARGRVPRSYLLAASAVAVTLVPIAFVLPMQMRAFAALENVSPLPAYAIALAVADYVYPHRWIGSWIHLPVQNAAYALAAGLPIAIVVAARSHATAATRALGCATLVIAALFAGVIGIGHIHVLFPRHTAVLFLPSLLTAFAAIGGVALPRRRLALGTFGCVYGALVALSLSTDYRGMSKSGDWRRVGTFLTAHVAVRDAVAVFDSEATLPLGFYARNLALVPIPRRPTYERFDERDFALASEADVAASLGSLRDRRYVWLVTSDVCATQRKFFGCAYLDRFVAEHFRVVGIVPFDRSSVAQLVPLPRLLPRRGDVGGTHAREIARTVVARGAGRATVRSGERVAKGGCVAGRKEFDAGRPRHAIGGDDARAER